MVSKHGTSSRDGGQSRETAHISITSMKQREQTGGGARLLISELVAGDILPSARLHHINLPK